jgi:hypothetical protein
MAIISIHIIPEKINSTNKDITINRGKKAKNQSILIILNTLTTIGTINNNTNSLTILSINLKFICNCMLNFYLIRYTNLSNNVIINIKQQLRKNEFL